MTQTINLEDLPISLRRFDLSDAESDARHLAQLLGSAFEELAPLRVDDPESRGGFNSLAAFLWIARDLAETLHWKMERLDMTHKLQPKGQ